MLFVPKRQDCRLWNDKLQDQIYIIYDFKQGDIHFKLQKFYPLQWFNAQIVECCKIDVQVCSLNVCSCSPQLRYNDIIKKWYCCCPSSALAVKQNDDKSELETMFFNTEITKQNGFADNAVEAVMLWNIKMCKNIIDQCNTKIKEMK